MHADIFICILKPEFFIAFAIIANLLILIPSPAMLSHKQRYSWFTIEQDTEVFDRIHIL
jgi:hypothetical protein